MWRTPATLAGSLADVPNAAPRVTLILALETSCDDTCAAVVDARRAHPLQRHLLAGHPRPLRRRGARGRLPPPPRAGQRRRRRRARARRARRSTTSSAWRSPRARAWSARCWWAWRPPRRSPPRAGCRSCRSTTSRATWRPTSSRPSRCEPPFLCLIASGGHTLLARVERHDGFEVLGQTLDDAAGEAFDKGARLLGLRLPGRPGAGAPGRGRRSRRRSPSRSPSASPGLDFSFAGLKTALLYRVRDLGEEEARAPARRPRRLLPARDRGGAGAPRRARARRRPACERLAVGGGVAANGPLRERLRRRWASS